VNFAAASVAWCYDVELTARRVSGNCPAGCVGDRSGSGAFHTHYCACYRNPTSYAALNV